MRPSPRSCPRSDNRRLGEAPSAEIRMTVERTRPRALVRGCFRTWPRSGAVEHRALRGGAATYPTGFEEQTIVTGLSRPTTVAWAPDGRMFVAEKDGALKVVAAGWLDGHGWSPTTRRGSITTPTGDCWAWPSTRSSPRTATCTCSTPTTSTAWARRTAPLRWCRSSCASRSTPSNQVTDDDGHPRDRTSRPLPDGRRTTLDCIPPTAPRTRRHGALGARRHALGGQRRRHRLRRRRPRALRTRRGQHSGQAHARRPQRHGLPGHRFCPADTTSRTCAPSCTQGLRNPFRFSLGPAAASRSATWAGTRWEEIDLVGARRRSNGWPCYEGSGRTPGYEELPSARPSTPSPHRAPAAPVSRTADRARYSAGRPTPAAPTRPDTATRSSSATTPAASCAPRAQRSGGWSPGLRRRLVGNGARPTPTAT